MRIEELYLDGFGHFHQQTLGPLSGAVTVFLGPNEAGKSTTLAFIRAILFGFPARNRDSHYPPLSGGRHGGRIKLASDSGAAYTLERYAGAHGGPLRIQNEAGETLNAAVILPGLTGNATPDLFRNVFAFSLDELQVAASLNDSSGAIYSAGQGAPGLPALTKSLGDQKGLIYLSRGNVQKVPTLLKDLQTVDTQLRYIEGNAGRYGALTTRRAEIGAELEKADAELGCLASQRSEVRKLLDGWEDWLSLSDREARLRDLPQFDDFPEDAVLRLDNLEEQIRQATEARDKVAAQLRRLEESAGEAIPGEDLLYDAASIEGIRRDRNRFDSAVKDLPERTAELGALESELQDRLRDLGADWDENRLQAFDASLVVRNQVDGWKERITETGERVQRAQFQLAQERRTLQDRRDEAQEARDKLPPEPPLSATLLSQRQDALRTARGRLSEYKRQRQHRDTLNVLTTSRETPEPDKGRQSLLVILLEMAAAIFVVTALLDALNIIRYGYLGGLIMVLIAAVVWYLGSKRTSDVESPITTTLGQQTADAEMATETARQSFLDSAAALGLDGQPDAATLDSVEASLEAARLALEGRNVASVRIADASRREKAQEQRVEASVLEREAAKAPSEAAQREWREWLVERELDEALRPDTMVMFIARVETARSSLSETRRMRERVLAIEDDIEEFRGVMQPLAIRHGLTMDEQDPRQLAHAADELIRRLDETQDAYSDRERAREQAENTRQQLELREQHLQAAEKERAELLAAGGTEEAEELRRRARQHAERLELERQRDEHRRGLERLGGPGERYDAFRDALSTADPNQLAEESAQLSERYAEVDARRNVLREERGGIDTELAQLTGEEESSALRIRRSTLEEQLREYAREWSRLTIAEALLDRTRQKFEQERQPGVIRHAQDFFSAVTGHRYQRLFAPIGEQNVTATDATGAGKRPEELSRGTREQLYLALRFGLIREFGEHAEPLPVVVDEALVNFDPERARLAAEAFAQLAKTNQVLVFTCHPSTAEMFADSAAAKVVELGA